MHDKMDYVPDAHRMATNLHDIVGSVGFWQSQASQQIQLIPEPPARQRLANDPALHRDSWVYTLKGRRGVLHEFESPLEVHARNHPAKELNPSSAAII